MGRGRVRGARVESMVTGMAVIGSVRSARAGRRDIDEGALRTICVFVAAAEASASGVDSRTMEEVESVMTGGAG